VKSQADQATKIKIIQLIISAILLGLFLTWIDFSQLKQSIVKADGFYLGMALGVVCINRVLMPVKWNILVKAKQIHIGWFDVIKIYYISSFLGLYLPPTVGADSVRVYYTAKKGYSVPDVLTSIIVERALGFLVLILFVLFGCVIFIHCFTNIVFDIHNILLISLLINLLILFGFFISMSNYFIQVFSNFLMRLSSRKLIGKAANMLYILFQSYCLYKSKKKFLTVFFLLTCAEMVLPITRSYFIAKAFNISLPLYYYFAFVPIVIFLIRLPISADGFGIHEGGFAYFLSLMGVSQTLGFSVGVISHCLLWVSLVPGLIFYIFEKKGSSLFQLGKPKSNE